MNKVVFRESIKPTDISRIIALHAEYYSKHHGFNQEFEAYVAIPLSEFVLRKDPKEHIWLVEQNEVVEGAIALTKVSNEEAQLRWFIINSPLRGKGIGEELIKRLLKFARENDYKRISLWTISELHEAIRLYQKYGFILAEEQSHTMWGKEVNEQKYVKELVDNCA